MNQAIKLDPKFALPYLGIATYYAIATDFYLAPSVAMPQLKIAAQTAIEMDSTIAEAHVWLGNYEHWYAWDWDKAEKEFQTALRLEPNNYVAHWMYSFYLMTVSRMDEAKIEGARITELEPMSAEAHAWNGLIFFFSRQYDDALPEINKGLMLDPNYPFALYFRSAYYLEERKFPEAIADRKKADELFAAPWSHARLAYAYACAGKTKEAISILDSLKKESATVYVASDVVASVYVALGDKEHAFEYLQKAVDERAGWLAFIQVDPIWDPIRSDPRFDAILKKIGLDEGSLKH
jgi:tetratricopeptide (TPR) repeat protein